MDNNLRLCRLLCIVLRQFGNLLECQIAYTNTSEDIISIDSLLCRIRIRPRTARQTCVHCILEHRNECGFEYFGEILNCRRRLTRVPKLSIHRSAHKIIIPCVQYSVQIDIAQKKFLIIPIKCIFNGMQRIVRCLYINVKIPKKPRKQQEYRENCRHGNPHFHGTAHHRNLLPIKEALIISVPPF